MSTNVCKFCKFWDQPFEHIARSQSECRRHSPMIADNKFDKSIPFWPITQDYHWCGDFEHAVSEKRDGA